MFEENLMAAFVWYVLAAITEYDVWIKKPLLLRFKNVSYGVAGGFWWSVDAAGCTLMLHSPDN